MENDQVVERDQDIGRGTALLITGAVLFILKWVLPVVTPLAIGGYAIYRFYRKELGEGLIFMALAVLAWFLRVPLGWLLWVIGAGFVAFGVFYLIKGMRGESQVSDTES